MNDEQFENEQIERDNAGKVKLDSLTEALARVEAERERWRSVAEWIECQRDTAQAQLAEAVGLLQGFAIHTFPSRELIDKRDDFLARHAQAEQKEAQGAQAVDERAAFEDVCRKTAIERCGECSPEALRKRPDGTYVSIMAQCGWWAWQARAALATQAAEWVDPVALHPAENLYNQGFDAGAAASKRLNAVRGAEHE